MRGGCVEGARDLHRAREAGGEKQTMARRAAATSRSGGGGEVARERSAVKLNYL